MRARRKTGARRSSPFRQKAGDAPDTDAPARLQPAKRPCLRCGRDFHSEWCGNRMCPNCRGRTAGVEG